VDLSTLESEFAVTEHRKALFEAYLLFLGSFQKEILENGFFQWVNGSYVSKKPIPKDIDVVTFLDYKVYEAKEKQLSQYMEDEFEAKGLDLYFVKIFPENHKQRFITDFDKVEWLHLFSTNRKKESKGFLQINF
jgi:hypothetical protein